MSGVSAIVLAAGAGSRFGGEKLLAEFEGRPLIEHALIALRDAPVDEIVVVVGPDAGRLREVCEPYSARVVENPDWALGQSTSVKAGLRTIDRDARAAVVLLGDQPLVRAEAVRRLVESFEEGAKVAVATYAGKRRNPVLFSRLVWSDLLAGLSGDEGARSVLRERPELVVEVDCSGVSDPTDVDTTEDLRRLRGARADAWL